MGGAVAVHLDLCRLNDRLLCSCRNRGLGRARGAVGIVAVRVVVRGIVIGIVAGAVGLEAFVALRRDVFVCGGIGLVTVALVIALVGFVSFVVGLRILGVAAFFVATGFIATAFIAAALVATFAFV